MVAKLLTTSIAAPGFQGLNTQDSSISLEAGYATVAENCVIDKFGRIGARKGWTPEHSSNVDLGTATVKSIGELLDSVGNTYIVVSGNNKLFTLDSGVLTEITYGGGGSAPTITANNWQMAPLNNCLYLYQDGHEPLVFEPDVSNTEYLRISEKVGSVGTPQNGRCVISAYGRTWSAAPSTNRSMVEFSDIHAGHVVTTGTAGYLDVAEVWPNGNDEIIALAAHNNFLIIFGKRQILVYANALNPFDLSLSDVITGTGCIARDSVVATGSDIVFLSESGVKSLMRTIQEKSAPMRDLSANVRDDLVYAVDYENNEDIKAVYSDKEAFYLLSLPSRQLVYCFDTRTVLQNGSNRATTWTNLVPTAFCYTQNKDLLVGTAGYVGKYDGYIDNVNTYTLKYYTNYFDFQSPTVIKLMKKVALTVLGGGGYTIQMRFGFDYKDILNTRQFGLTGASPAEYAISEYAIAEYGGTNFNTEIINIGGSGKVIQLGIETQINNKPISIQKLDVYVKPGKTI